MQKKHSREHKQSIHPELAITFIQGQTRKNEKQQMEPAMHSTSQRWINMDFLYFHLFLFISLWWDSLQHHHVNHHFYRTLMNARQERRLEAENLCMTDERQVMFQPPKLTPWHFWKWAPPSRAPPTTVSHMLVGNGGEYWGPNSFLVKTGHTAAAIKLEGMLGARLVISLSVSLGLHLSRLLLERINERQALVRACAGSHRAEPRGQSSVWASECWVMKGVWRGQGA